jgi:hypothetical protein
VEGQSCTTATRMKKPRIGGFAQTRVGLVYRPFTTLLWGSRTAPLKCR